MFSLLSRQSNQHQISLADYNGNVSVEVQQLTVQLANKPILRNIDLCLHRSEFTALLGPNGTGKSTLLKAITNEIEHQGNIKLYGQERCRWSAPALARHLGVLPQHSSLSFNFTAQEVVELGAIGLSMTNSEIKNVVKTNMLKTDVTHLAQRYYPTLSGGEKQRVHLARVLTQLEQSQNNTTILLDEPTSALDLHHQHTTLALAKSLAEQGATVVAVLHDLNLAAQYADRLVILNQGSVAIDATPEIALQQEIIEQVYCHKVSIIPHPQLGHPLVIAN
ncbi:heme ABC transporter ATP-binding protein [Vibrio ponticus]|uniref:Heme ABC transporter ATP-binding protein n=1 Tax=Vibrio ponticus TaxID=265668 RepID=A0A3N3DTT1_9VIBR|nr:heme ABC transporter ATP-binding protein [Vibrio ponticus]ROV57897.1 heme ABC transporter ATP-binding protein [Vibrio ponticus]